MSSFLLREVSCCLSDPSIPQKEEWKYNIFQLHREILAMYISISGNASELSRPNNSDKNNETVFLSTEARFGNPILTNHH